MTPDIINGLFEFIGGLSIGLHIRDLYKQKKVAGVSIFPIVLFTSWGFWNIFFYSNLLLWLSFTGGIVMCLLNSIWLGQLIYYTKFYKAKNDLGRV